MTAARNIVVSNYYDDNYSTQSPYWIMLTVPYKFMDTVDRAKVRNPGENGFRVVTSDEAIKDGNSTYNPIIWDNEVVDWNITQGKSNHIIQFSANLLNADNNVASFIWLTPGDWCMFWAFNNRKDYNTIRSRLQNSYGAKVWTERHEGTSDGEDGGNADDVNFYSSGLKFVGRIHSISHYENRQPDGRYQIGYRLQARMFSELDNVIYYNGLLVFKYQNALQFMPDFGIGLKNFLSLEGKNKGYVNTNVFIPGFIKIALGEGPGSVSKNQGDRASVEGKRAVSGLTASPNVSYDVPPIVMKMMGRQDAGGENKYYSDLLLQIIGVQKYSEPSRETWDQLLPDGVLTSRDSIFYCLQPIVDFFQPDPQLFNNKSAWQTVEAYLNAPLNEAYTCLRPHPSTGRLLPALVVRRMPYSSADYADSPSDDKLAATAFAEIPRWVIPTGLVKSFEAQRSDAQRYNYIHVSPSSTFGNAITVQQANLHAAPPIVDETSIRRYGLRMCNIQVAGFANPLAESNKKNTASRYTSFMADIMLDGHLRLNGQMTTVGIQDPIQPGDNLSMNGLIFQIESLHHIGGIDASGQKRFDTTLNISYGAPASVIGGNGDKARLATKEAEDKYFNDAMRVSQGLATEADVAKDLSELVEKINEEDGLTDGQLRKLRNDRRDLQDMRLLSTSVTNIDLNDPEQ